MRYQELLSEEEREEFFTALENIHSEVGSWARVQEVLNINHQTMSNWRRPEDGKTNLKGRLPARIVRDFVIQKGNESKQRVLDKINEIIEEAKGESEYAGS